MSTSPPPEEREKKDAEAKAKQDEEQARLPYKWNQTISDLDIIIPIGANIKGRDCDISIAKTKIKVALKGQDPFIDVGGHNLTCTAVMAYTRALESFLKLF